MAFVFPKHDAERVGVREVTIRITSWIKALTDGLNGPESIVAVTSGNFGVHIAMANRQDIVPATKLLSPQVGAALHEAFKEDGKDLRALFNKLSNPEMVRAWLASERAHGRKR